MMEVNKCSIVNLKFTMPKFFDTFGRHHPDNQGPTVYVFMMVIDIELLSLTEKSISQCQLC